MDGSAISATVASENYDGQSLNRHKTYFENLDALRFFAFLNVFFCHCLGLFGYKFSNRYLQLIHEHFFSNGSFGVSFFFVLSGFLITWLLLAEKDNNGKINLGAFYMRRVLRIWPVYFLVVIIGFVVGSFDFPLLDRHHFNYKIGPEMLKWYLTFMVNLEMLINGCFSSTVLGVLWSVSVEEQFYLVWPFLFLFFKRKMLPAICIVAIAVSFVFRCFPATVYASYSTPEVMSYLAFGGLIAYYALYKPGFILFFKTLSKKAIIVVYFLLFLYLPAIGFAHIFGEKIYSVYRPFQGLLLAGFFCFVILEQNYSDSSFFKFGRVASLTRLGRISYGLYAYHMLAFPIVFFIADNFGISNTFFGYLIKIIFAFLLTIMGSFLSYRFMEKNILYLKKYFQPIDKG